MAPTIRIDEEVYKKLQEKARPQIDTPNDVLRKLLGLDQQMCIDPQDASMNKALDMEQDSESAKDSIVIVVNAAGDAPNSENAYNGYTLTKRRIASGVDILAPSRLRDARRLLKQGTRILMHQGGAVTWRTKYPTAGHLVAAGRVKAPARDLTQEDIRDYHEDFQLTQTCYPDSVLAGIILYEFPEGVAKEPLPKEKAGYQPGRGDNFIEITHEDRRYANIFRWWEINLNLQPESESLERSVTMAKLIIEWGEHVRLDTELEDPICERLWRFEKKEWRGKRENTISSWRTLMAEIFDTYLKSHNY